MMTPEERDELLAATIYAALVGLTAVIAGLGFLVYKIIEICNQ